MEGVELKHKKCGTDMKSMGLTQKCGTYIRSVALKENGC